MDIRRAFAASAYLLVLTGILSLSIAEGSPAIILLATLLCFAAYWTAERMRRPIGRVGTNLGVAAVILLTPVDYAFLTAGDPIITATHFLLAVQIVKLFGTKAPRDYLQLFAVSLIHLGVAAVITVELLFSVAFVIYLVVATWTLCLFLLHRELEENARTEAGKIRSGRGLLGTTALASIAALALTIVVFFVFPRFSAVIFDIKRGRQAGRTSGFTNEIGLTDLSEIRLNPETVLNVTPIDMGVRFPAEPKWRGFSFDRYEAGKWSRSWLKERAARPEARALSFADRGDPRSGGWTIRRGGRAPAPADAYATYKILQAPLGLDSNILFGVPDVDRVEFPFEKPSLLVVDKGDAILGSDLKPVEVMYIVRSLPSRREAAKLAELDLDQGPLGSRVDWLQLPSSPTLTARLRALASEVIADAKAVTPYQKCEALERHLSTRYSYTLELTPAPKDEDPILHFLFTTREGHCELSATAFVLMCRTQGIPARLVNGFQSGQWNEYTGAWVVRQMEAHAWAEVKFAGEAGWVDFDPTPWAGPGGGGGGVLSRLEKLQDYLRMRWLSYVVSWSQSDQLSAAQKAKNQIDEWRRALEARLKSLRDWVPRISKDDLSRKLYIIAAALAIGFALLWFFMSRRAPGKRAVRPRVTRRVPFFEEWTRALEKRGFRRRLDETPLELARRAEKDGGAPLRGSTRLVEVFYRVRFAEDELTAAERALVDGIIASAAGRNPAPVR